MVDLLAVSERVAPLLGGTRQWWDVAARRFVPTATVYLPQGCLDWGETNGKRNGKCTFCMLPNAVAAYRDAFHGGEVVPVADQPSLFAQALGYVAPASDVVHTLCVFNAGSFLASVVNPPELQRKLMIMLAGHRTIRRVVIESRAELICDEAIAPLMDILQPAGMRLTVRIGVESQDDNLRLRVLRKGHSRRQLRQAVSVLRKYEVNVGGYALLNPAPGLDREWALAEAQQTLDFILGDEDDQLSMDEAYFCSTNVGPGTPLEGAWKSGEFWPATPWMVLHVLQYGIERYGRRVHLLPFRDEPELLAVPSSHVDVGLPQDLTGAAGCDVAFHQMFQQYRASMDPQVLVAPDCNCRPDWYTKTAGNG